MRAFLFFPCDIHLEAMVVKVHEFREVAAGAVVEVGSGSGESVKDRAASTLVRISSLVRKPLVRKVPLRRQN